MILKNSIYLFCIIAVASPLAAHADNPFVSYTCNVKLASQNIPVSSISKGYVFFQVDHVITLKRPANISMRYHYDGDGYNSSNETVFRASGGKTMYAASSLIGDSRYPFIGGDGGGELQSTYVSSLLTATDFFRFSRSNGSLQPGKYKTRLIIRAVEETSIGYGNSLNCTPVVPEITILGENTVSAKWRSVDELRLSDWTQANTVIGTFDITMNKWWSGKAKFRLDDNGKKINKLSFTSETGQLRYIKATSIGSNMQPSYIGINMTPTSFKTFGSDTYTETLELKTDDALTSSQPGTYSDSITVLVTDE